MARLNKLRIYNMAISVPQSVFDKYFEVIDSTFTIFGVTCQLVFTEMEKIDYDPDNSFSYPSRNRKKRKRQL